MLRLIRLLGGALGVILTINLVGFDTTSDTLLDPSLEGRLLLLAWIAAWGVVGFVIAPYLTVVPARWIIRAVTDMSTDEFVAAIAGLLVGLLMGFLLGLPLTNLPAPAGLLLPIGVSIVLALGMMGLTVAKRNDLRAALESLGLRRRPDVVDTTAQQIQPITFLDTSAIIDGRIVDVVASGFLSGLLVVPRFVLGELQHIADDSHPGRRNRGRRGLDVLGVLQKDHRVAIEVSADDEPSASTVDTKLVALAQRRDGAILTTDYNLNRVAQLQGVRVMNLNQLANALKPSFLPGEALRVKVVQEGKEPGQGVAFLDDGTMVVVEGGSAHIEGELDVTVTRILQTVAGRISSRSWPARDHGATAPRAAGHTGVVIGEQIVDAVIVAAGASRRMVGQDKLSATIAGRPLLRWAVDAFAAEPRVSAVIVVTTAQGMADLEQAPWVASSRTRLVVGGARRQDSVAAGVRATSAEIVLVHDAARPLVSADLIGRVIDGVRERGAVVPVLPLVDALKRVDGDVETGTIGGTADRSGLFRAQTPQGARRDLLLGAVERHAGGPEEFRDEAELLARDGVLVGTVAGEADNIKVTLPEDLDLARRLVGASTAARAAVGFDSHPFGPGDGLRLGGLVIEDAPRLHGHSDGDVVLHALCDGLLAAAGDGDLGRLFPSGDPGTRDVDSRVLVAEVLRRLAATGLVPDSIDVTITAARPRLGARRLDAMAQSIASLTGVQPVRVSVKASTGNLAGDDGAGRAISAACLVGVVAR